MKFSNNILSLSLQHQLPLQPQGFAKTFALSLEENDSK